MKKILKGVRKFQREHFPKRQATFEQLAHGQNPRVLFITCSDSRIDPNLITQMDVGELFVIRNAGNLVPPFGSANGGEGAAIEYGIHALGIEQVIICGHSHCGAMKGLLKVESLRTEMPLVYEWLEHAEATRRLIKENYSDREGEELLDITIAENVLTQIENLKTYPVVRSKLHQGKMQIYGWIYEIETGEVLAYDPKLDEFVSPQTYLAMYENLPAPVPGRYTQTSAPPTSLDSSHNSGWLSAAQVDRIYRGTAK